MGSLPSLPRRHVQLLRQVDVELARLAVPIRVVHHYRAAGLQRLAGRFQAAVPVAQRVLVHVLVVGEVAAIERRLARGPGCQLAPD